MNRLRAWLWQERWTIAIFLAALLVRLHWNLVVHPLGDYIYSDMNGYNSRADRMVREPFGHHEYQAFFPFGTHMLIAGFKAVFGLQNFRAIGVGYALLGATAVTIAFTLARRVSSFPWVAPAVGLFCVFYYPYLAIGGYMLSELPFSAFLMISIWFSMRLLDEGKYRNAIGMGFFVGVAALCRPQVLMAVGLVGLFWLWRRRELPKVRLVHLVVAAVPLALVLAFSMAHFRWMTGRNGLVSENGPFNMVFGRCHNSKIESLPDGKGHGKVHFRPPEFLQLNNLLERKRKEGVEPPIKLDPIIGDVLNYKGYIGDRDQHGAYIKECLKKTTLWRQAQYSYTNLILLWRYNVPWPDSGRGQWREPSRLWTRFHELAIAVPSLLFLVTLFRRRWVRQGWLALHLLSVLIVAAMYFGGTRHRASYDPLLIFFAFEVYSVIGVWAWTRITRWRTARAGARAGVHGPPSDTP
ncbi:MAG: glycosyltransferase family 39 protein [Deltaproteobacteria bacterium]|nr:glycosyltransferase family 39 protein [Nannocystaceae bacterium]